MTDRHDASTKKPRPFAESLRRGVLIGAAALALVIPVALHFAPHGAKPATTPPQHEIRHADFGAEAASPDARRLANWVTDSRDNATHSFVVLDKREAKVFLFDRNGRLQAATPTVIGSAIGDDLYPGVGDKPLSELKPYERTTPAGRFVAELGETASRHEDVVWVDYDSATSMHRIIKVPERLNAIATPDPADNRLSNGCINLPDAFYEKSLRPAVDHDGVVVYILPETRAVQQTFASFYDVDAPPKLAQQ
ncbi:MAG TPA: L,D-transpeptidase [Ramlibacter sp.]|nr:L,D-transpeptidase [Ramlibacter sp.]